MLEKRLEDLDYRIAQFRREAQGEDRLRRRRKALLTSHDRTREHLEDRNHVLRAEEVKLKGGVGLFHHGLERLLVEDIVSVENLEVFKAAGQYTALQERLEDLETEVTQINGVLERRKDHHEHLAMLEEWREDLYSRVDRDIRERNALLHQRLDAWLRLAEREDDLEDLGEAQSALEETLMSLEAAIAAATRVRQVTKRDLAVLANLQPPRTKQFLLIEMLRNAIEGYRHASILIDTLQGIEHLKVHIRDPQRILDGLMEALLLDHYEGERPRHALRDIHDSHKYYLQIREAIKARKRDVGREIDELKLEEDELLLVSIDRRLSKKNAINRW
jgi:hypothetical protein